MLIHIAFDFLYINTSKARPTQEYKEIQATQERTSNISISFTNCYRSIMPTISISSVVMEGTTSRRVDDNETDEDDHAKPGVYLQVKPADLHHSSFARFTSIAHPVIAP